MIDAINSVVMRAYLGMKREEGQTFVEYSLIGVVVAVALAAILLTFESAIAGALGNIGNSLVTKLDWWRQVSNAALTCRPPRRSIHMITRIRKNEDGQTLVEFALVAPLLFLILFGIVQYGMAFKNSITLSDAVRTGARQATVSRNAPDPIATTKASVVGAASDLDTSKLNVTVTAPPWQPGATVTVTATYPYSINLLGIVVASGNLKSSTTERVEY